MKMSFGTLLNASWKQRNTTIQTKKRNIRPKASVDFQIQASYAGRYQVGQTWLLRRPRAAQLAHWDHPYTTIAQDFVRRHCSDSGLAMRLGSEYQCYAGRCRGMGSGVSPPCSTFSRFPDRLH